MYDIFDPRDNSIFQKNVASYDINDRRALFVDWDSRNTNTDNEFWSVYILGAYQYTLDSDNDPETETAIYGAVDVITGVTGDLEGSGALIFMELHRPREIPGYSSDPSNLTSMANTVAHEVGHLFSGRHGDLGLMGDSDGHVLSSQFHPNTIRKIRRLLHP